MLSMKGGLVRQTKSCVLSEAETSTGHIIHCTTVDGK